MEIQSLLILTKILFEKTNWCGRLFCYSHKLHEKNTPVCERKTPNTKKFSHFTNTTIKRNILLISSYNMYVSEWDLDWNFMVSIQLLQIPYLILWKLWLFLNVFIIIKDFEEIYVYMFFWTVARTLKYCFF